MLNRINSIENIATVRVTRGALEDGVMDEVRRIVTSSRLHGERYQVSDEIRRATEDMMRRTNVYYFKDGDMLSKTEDDVETVYAYYRYGFLL